MTNPPATAEEIRAAVREQVVAELRDFTPEQAAVRLAELGEYTRPSARQRVEREVLETQVNTATLALAAYQAGDNHLFDGVRDAATGMVIASTPGGVRRAGPQSELAGRAARVLDSLHKRGLPDHAAATAETLMRSPHGAGDRVDESRTLAQRWLAVAGSPEYERAFAALIRDPVAGAAELDEKERAAWRAGRQVQAALGDGSGGGQYMLPVVIDPAIHLSNAGSNNPLRRIARVEQIATNQWLGVASAGATAEWVAEAAQVADGSPTLTQPAVPVFKGDSFVPVSFEWFQDAQDGMAELQSILVDAAGLLQNTAYTVGTGSGQPSGVVPGATTLTQVPTGAFALAHIYQTQNALPPRFSANAQWCGNIAVQNTIAQFTTTGGANWAFPEIRSAPQQLAGKPWNELSDMTSDMSTTGAKYLLYGAFENLLIVDRIGSTIEIVQNLVGAAFRPTGQRGALLWFRSGSAVLVPNAFRVLVKA